MLRKYDTCATGVVFFHRFYMFHSFTEFPRCVTAACCLFLAGKVEETPKKCKDLIKVTKGMLSETQFATFKEDPKEEIMTLERILLQTIKFDLMVEHPYAYLLKFAKLIKGDKVKIEKLVQMSWTFINDSLCTTLSLQWEPEVIAVALMYLASRLNKFEITDWHGKPLGYRGKWYDFFIEDVSLDLLEDICHQVLDLYSKPTQKSCDVSPTVQSVKSKSSTYKNIPISSTINEAPSMHILTSASSFVYSNDLVPNNLLSVQVSQSGLQSSNHPHHIQPSAAIHYNQTNPYMSSGMYSSSFMDKEGSQSIQSLVDGQDTSQKLQNYKYAIQASSTISTPLISSIPIQHQNSGFSYQQITHQLPVSVQSQPLVTNYLASSNIPLTSNIPFFKDTQIFQGSVTGLPLQNKVANSVSYENRTVPYYIRSHPTQHSNWR